MPEIDLSPTSLYILKKVCFVIYYIPVCCETTNQQERFRKRKKRESERINKQD